MKFLTTTDAHEPSREGVWVYLYMYTMLPTVMFELWAQRSGVDFLWIPPFFEEDGVGWWSHSTRRRRWSARKRPKEAPAVERFFLLLAHHPFSLFIGMIKWKFEFGRVSRAGREGWNKNDTYTQAPGRFMMQIGKLFSVASEKSEIITHRI